MNTELIGQFLVSPNWFRAILAIVLFIYAVRLPVRPPCFPAFVSIPLIFLLRDIALFFVQAQTIVLTAEYIIMSIYLCWVCGYRSRSDGRIFVIAVSPLMASITVLSLVSQEAPVWDVLHT